MVYLCNEIKKYSCRSKEGWWPTKPVMEVRILPGVQNWSFGRLGVCDGLKIHRTRFNSARLRDMVVVAQLARAPDCGSGGRGFEPLHSPKREYSSVVERMAVNHRVVGSSPSIPANKRSGGEAANVSVCRTDIRGFESLSELKRLFSSTGRASAL